MKQPFKTKFPDKYEYYKIDLDNPIVDLRADLKAIPLAIAQGYEVVEGETFADQISFKKGAIRVWATIRAIRAELVDGYYTNHQEFDTFKEALI